MIKIRVTLEYDASESDEDLEMTLLAARLASKLHCETKLMDPSRFESVKYEVLHPDETTTPKPIT